MMLVQGYPFEMQGRLAEALATTARAPSRSRAWPAHPHYLFWALFELGWAHYFAGRLDAAMAACEESLRVGGRLTRGTMPSAGGGPGWALAACRFESRRPGGDARTRARARRRGPRLGDPRREVLQLGEPGAGRARARAPGRGPRLRRSRRAGDAAALDLELPDGAGRAHARPRCVLAGGDAAEAARAGRAVGDRRDGRRRRAAGGVLAQPARARARGGRRPRTRRSPSCARPSSELDACGSRARARRGRGASCASSAPAPSRAGRRRRATRAWSALTKREREIAELVTDRMTNREIAARAVPQREDDRVAPAQPVHQARRVVADRRRAHGRARARVVTAVAPR